MLHSPSRSRSSLTKRVVALLLVCLLAIPLSIGLAGCANQGTNSDARSFTAQHLNRATAAAVLGENAVRSPQETAKTGTVTVLVYMNGSNLESEGGLATDDISEMIAAGSSDAVNVVLETVGTSRWRNYNISSRHSQRYEVNSKGLTLVDNSLGQLDCTKASTLSDFITWGVENYPADRYELILWDHGGGPVFGFGYDEWQDEGETLTLDEMQTALDDAGVHFDFIGFDACLMSSLEVCCALYKYCDYTIVSEDFETGIGWAYTGWLKALYRDPTISTPNLGKIIVDDMVSANERNRHYGGDATLSVIDEGMMNVLFATWVDFAYANEDKLMAANYSRGVQKSTRPLPQSIYNGAVDANNKPSSDNDTMADYFITDILAVAQNVKSKESQALSAALAEAIIYTNATKGDAHLTGLSVTIPYGNSSFYRALKVVFTRCGFDSNYIDWLGNFTTSNGSSEHYDYTTWDEEWHGWGGYFDDFDWSSWTFNGQGIWSNDHFISWADILKLVM